MSMKILRELEAESVLLRACEAVSRHGLSRALTKSPDGSLNCYGAIYVASGANHRLMPFDCGDAVEAGVPEKFQALAEEICLYVESFCCTEDLNNWANTETRSKEDVAKMFSRAAVRLIIMGDG